MNISNGILEHQCPQCGAVVSLSDTDRLFSCPYCRVALFITFQEHGSLYLSTNLKEEHDFFYMPYWWCKGTEYSLSIGGTSCNVVDRSIIAADYPGFPQTLGIRSQTVKKKFIEPATPGSFLKPRFPFDALKKRIVLSPEVETREVFFSSTVSASVSGFLPPAEKAPDFPVMKTALVGETVNLLYAPYFLKNNVLFDGISGAKLGPVSDSIFVEKGWRPAGPTFISTLCPECGGDCGGERDSLVVVCATCGRAWHAAANGLLKTDYAVWNGDSQADLWLPFWRLDVSTPKVRLESVADFIRFVNAPRAVLPLMENQRFFFWVPAFKVNPQLFLLLSKLLTTNQKEPRQAEDISRKSSFYPVTLDAAEGFDAAPVVLGDISQARKRVIPLLNNLELSLRSTKLVYVPLVRRGMEYVQPELDFGVQERALKMGRLI